jgi:hypothetical protein
MIEAAGFAFLEATNADEAIHLLEAPARHHSGFTVMEEVAFFGWWSLRPASDLTQLSLRNAHPASLAGDGYLFPSPRYKV